MRINRRQFLRALLALPATGGLGAGYMRLFEPEWLVVTRKRATVSGVRQPLRILHLSDFHASPVVSYAYIQRAIEHALRLPADLAFLTGDFITWRLEQKDRYRQILSGLTRALPTYACLGNHDGGRWAGSSHGYTTPAEVAACLRDSNVQLLVNQATVAEIAGTQIEIVGLGDYWSGETRPALALERKRRANRPVLLLCHNPDAKSELKEYDWDLMFAGHTHGGQLIVPLLGARPFLPIRDKRFAEGLLEYDGRLIHVTRGIGNLHGLRFNCRPEISLVELG